MGEKVLENREVAIQLAGVKKKYRLGAIGGRTLQRELQSWWAKKRGKEDPNVRIGLDQRLIGQEFMALNGIDLTVYKGERLGIIGANGAGKSTMLKLLSRVTAPTEGEIDIWGRVSSMLEVGTGFHGEMTGRENIYMNGAILGMTTAEIDQRLEDIIDFSEVREFIDTPVKRYSSGMFVKLAFSVAAHLNSEIMIMDEVLAVGDMAFQKKCLDKMRQAADQEGRTILYVSHNMNTIRTLCERCIVLDEGKIIFDGDVEEAIGVYMNRSIEENEVDMDLTAKSHTPGKGIDTGLFMERLELLDGSNFACSSDGGGSDARSVNAGSSDNWLCKVTPVYESHEDLLLRMTLKVTRPVKKGKLRLTMRTDADVGIGTAWSEPMDFPEEGQQTVLLRFPMTQLQKGIFYASIGFYEEMDLGRVRMLDHITRAFRIELTGIPTWYVPAHGYVKLEEGKIIV